MSQFVTYTHPSGIFSLDIPDDWSVHDDSKPGIALTSFASPDAAILMRVAVNTAPADNSADALGHILRLFVEGTSGQETDFDISDVEEADDETLALSFSYTRGTAEIGGDAYIWYDEPYAAMFLVAMPEDLWDEQEDLIDEIADSLAIEPDATLPV